MFLWLSLEGRMCRFVPDGNLQLEELVVEVCWKRID